MACAYVAGLFARSLIHTSVQLGWLAMGALLIGGLLASRAAGSQRETQVLLTLGFVAAALAHTPARHTPIGGTFRGTARILGVVEASLATSTGTTCVLRVVNAAPLEPNSTLESAARIRVSPCLAEEGAQIRVLARVSPIVRFRNPSPAATWPSTSPIAYRAVALSAAARDGPTASFAQRTLAGSRTRLRAALREHLSPRTAGIAQALVLGDAAAVDAQDVASVRRAGLSHVLAVSGMHVSILVGLLVFLMRQALLRLTWLAERVDVRRIACAVGAPVALLYAEFAGASPSAYRAGIASAIAWALVAIARRPRAGPVASVVAIGMSTWEPQLAVSPAFLLSTVATASLLAWQTTPPSSLRSLVITLAASSLRAWIATLPILMWCFGSAPLVSVLANLVLVPLGGVVLLPLAAIHAVVALVSSPVAHVSAALLEIATRAFVVGCEHFASVGTSQPIPPPSLLQLLVLGSACYAALLLRNWRARIVVGVSATLTLACAELWIRHDARPTGVLRMTFLDVAQGDSTLLDLPDGRLMLIDGGGNPDHGPEPGELVLLPQLRARRRERIDVVVITHPHPDHYGGVRALLGKVEIGEIWDSGQADGEPGHDEAAVLLARARALGIRVLAPPALCGVPHEYGGASVRVIAPCPMYDSGYEPNDNSLVVEIGFRGRRALFVGDAEAHEEARLISGRLLRDVDVLKVGHHGSRTSSTEEFLRAVRPEIAIVSAGRGNRFGHPHLDVLERLRRVHARVLRLDELGGITFELNENGIYKTDGMRNQYEER